MSQTTSAVAASTIGIDTGKYTLHLIGLDEQVMIVLRETDRHRSRYGHALCSPRADLATDGCHDYCKAPRGRPCVRKELIPRARMPIFETACA